MISVFLAKVRIYVCSNKNVVVCGQYFLNPNAAAQGQKSLAIFSD
jgi:hypothetical protein